MEIREKVSGAWNYAMKQAPYHVADSTAMLVESTPFFGLYEVAVAGMSDEVSLNTRVLATAFAFGGLGWGYGKGRDRSRRFFHVSDESSERVQSVHDFAYTAVFNLAVSPLMYYIAGERDLEKIAIGSVCAMGLGALNGIPMGYAVDVFRDLASLETCERRFYPDVVRKQSPVVKFAMAAGLAFLSLKALDNVYQHVPNGCLHPSNVVEFVEEVLE